VALLKPDAPGLPEPRRQDRQRPSRPLRTPRRASDNSSELFERPRRTYLYMYVNLAARPAYWHGGTSTASRLRLKRLQAGTAAELDAVLPSILDRAFNGEFQALTATRPTAILAVGSSRAGRPCHRHSGATRMASPGLISASERRTALPPARIRWKARLTAIIGREAALRRGP